MYSHLGPDLAPESLTRLNLSTYEGARVERNSSRRPSSSRVLSSCKCVWSQGPPATEYKIELRPHPSADDSRPNTPSAKEVATSDKSKKKSKKDKRTSIIKSTHSRPPVLEKRDSACPVHTSDLPLQSYEGQHHRAKFFSRASTPTFWDIENPYSDDVYGDTGRTSGFSTSHSSWVRRTQEMMQHAALRDSTKTADELASPSGRQTHATIQETIQPTSSHKLNERDSDSDPDNLLVDAISIMSLPPAEAQFREPTPDKDDQPIMSCDEEMSSTEDGSSMDEILSSISLPEDTTTPAPGPPVLSTRALVEQNVRSPCRKSLLDLLDIFETSDGKESAVERDLTDSESHQSEGSNSLVDEGQPGDANDTSEASGSGSRSTNPAGVADNQSGSKRQRASGHDGFEEDDFEDDQASKKPNQGREGEVEEEEGSSKTVWLPCLTQPAGCHGTNTSVSELIKDLGLHHGTVICVICYKLLEYSGDPKDARTFLKDHEKFSSCFARCISKSCRKGTGTVHDLTPECPREGRGEKAKMDKYKFIWNLVNPGQPLPKTTSHGPGFQHSQKLKPRKVNTKSKVCKGKEAVKEVALNVIATNHRIELLEAELEDAKRKIAEQNEIILGLFEHQILPNNIMVGISQQQVIFRVCSNVFQNVLKAQERLQRYPGRLFDILDPEIANPTPDSAQQGNGNAQAMTELQMQPNTGHDFINDQFMYGTAATAPTQDFNVTSPQLTGLREARGNLAEFDAYGMGT